MTQGAVDAKLGFSGFGGLQVPSQGILTLREGDERETAEEDFRWRHGVS
jgi:hypothetical protein